MGVTNLVKKFIVIFLILLMLKIVIARPLPCEYWGTVTINGQLAEDGLSVEAYINGNLYAVMQSGIIAGHYQIVIEADDPATPEKDGGQENDNIAIKVDGKQSDPILTWISGELNKTDLTINEDTPEEDETCSPNWSCTEWSECVDSKKTRSCVDINNCGVNEGKPQETTSCSSVCVPDWSCTEWSKCKNGEKERTCTDINNCGTDEGKPKEEKDCNDEKDGGGGGGNSRYEAPKKTEEIVSKDEITKSTSEETSKLSEEKTHVNLLPTGDAILETESKQNIDSSSIMMPSFSIIATVFTIIVICFLIIFLIIVIFRKQSKK